MLAAAWAPCCIATCATPGSSLPSCVERAESPTTKTCGCSASASVGCVVTRPARSSGTPSERASGDAATPAAHRTVCAGMRLVRQCTTPCSSICVTALPGDAPRRRVARATAARARAASRETCRARAGPPSTSRMRADSGWMLRKSCGSDWRAISASAPASSTPVGPPPTMTNVSSRRCFAGVGFALGRFEGEQHPPPDLERIVQRLQSRRAMCPFRMAEVGMRRAGRDDQEVVVDRRRASVDDHDRARGASMRLHVGEQHLNIRLLPQDPADRRRDVSRRQRRRSPPDTAAAGKMDSCGGRAA